MYIVKPAVNTLSLNDIVLIVVCKTKYFRDKSYVYIGFVIARQCEAINRGDCFCFLENGSCKFSEKTIAIRKVLQRYNIGASVLTDMLALVEGFWNFSCEDGVNRAYDYQYRGIRERDHVANVDVVLADEQVVFHSGMVVHRTGGIDEHPDHVY